MKNDTTMMNAYYTMTEGCDNSMLGLNLAFMMESRRSRR